jgi:hypothetical protein
MTGRLPLELIFALLAIVAITVGYAYLARDGAPAPGSFAGHTLGVLGFVLMLCTEVLYSVRKRWPNFHLGPMRTWLQGHVFTGLVGPYLVLLHAAWRFNGLAGVLTLLTLVVVLSGLVGRYLYTAVPRTLEGDMIAVCDLESRINAVDRQLRELGVPDLGTRLARVTALPGSAWKAVLFRPFIGSGRREMNRLLADLDDDHRKHAERMRQLLVQRQQSLLHVYSWEAARNLLSLWHSFHVPLSGALFALAGVHIIAALYYGMLSR